MRLRTVLYSVFGAWALVSCGPAEEPATVPVEPAEPVREEIEEPARTDVRLSPDGSWLAFLAPLAGDSQGLWLAPADDLAAARPASWEDGSAAEAGENGADTGGSVTGFRWAYAGGQVLCLRTNGVVVGGEEPRLYAVDARRGTARPLTPAGRAARLVHLSPSHPDRAVVELGGETEFGDLHALDLTSGELELIEENDRFTGWGLDGDLDLRLAFETADEGVRVSQRAELGGWVDFSWVPADRIGATRFLGFDDSASVAYFLDGRGRDHVALVGSHVISGRAEVLYQDSVDDVTEVLFDPVTGRPQAAAAGRGDRRWLALDERVRGDLARLSRVADGDLEIVDRTLDDRRWLIAIVPWEAPRRFYLYDRTSGHTELLFDGRVDLIARSGEAQRPAADEAVEGEIAAAESPS